MPAASASATSASRSSTSVRPASTASDRRRRPRAARASVSSPTAGTSKRGSCPGFATFTTHAPPRPSAQPRRIASSVPSIASSASTARSWTTTVWPTSSSPSAFAIGQANATSARCAARRLHRAEEALRRRAARARARPARAARSPRPRAARATARRIESSLRSPELAQQRERAGVGLDAAAPGTASRFGTFPASTTCRTPSPPQHVEQAAELAQRERLADVDRAREAGVGEAVEAHRRHPVAAAARGARELEREAARAPRSADGGAQRPLPDEAALRALEEGQQPVDLGAALDLGAHALDGVGEAQLRVEDQVEGVLDLSARLGREAAPAQAHDVEPARAARGRRPPARRAARPGRPPRSPPPSPTRRRARTGGRP